MNIDKNDLTFNIKFYDGEKYKFCYEADPFKDNPARLNILSPSVIILETQYAKIYRWMFKFENVTNKSIYRIIEDQIRDEAKNNVYSEEDKEILKVFVEKHGERTKEEIAAIFNEEEKTNIKPINNLECGIVRPYNFDLLTKTISDTIDQMYSSAAIDGTKGDISSKDIYTHNSMVPFDTIKDKLITDFINYRYYYDFIYKNKYIIFCIYESLKNYTSNYFLRYIAPIEVSKDSLLTLEEAVVDYYNNISGRVSPEYQRRIDAFQKKYGR